MRGYLITIITMLIACNIICVTMLEITSTGKALLNLNKLLIVNFLLSVFILRLGKNKIEYSGMFFLGSIPFRIALFLFVFFLTTKVDNVNRKQWTLTYLFTFLLFHFTETGFFVNQINKANEKN